MRHRPYPKLPREQRRDGLGGPWIALEKIHGAQLVVAVAGDQLCFGKRKEWLDDDEPFFGWRLVATALADEARRVAASVQAPQVFVYGELCGGAYPHPDVPPVPGLSPVQTGVYYAPDLQWFAFDVLVSTGPDDPGTVLSHADLLEVGTAAGLRLPPIIRRGSRADMATVPLPFDTQIPALLGLPPLPDNVAEGVVARPDRTMPAGTRPAYKRKLARFDDAAHLASTPFAPGPMSPDDLAAWGRRLVGPARLASARSKVGLDPERIVDEVVLDVLIDLEAAFADAMAAVDPEGLMAAIRRAAEGAV